MMRVDLDFVGMSFEEVAAQYPYDFDFDGDFGYIGDMYGEHYELYFEDGVCVECEYLEEEE